jgi:FlaA1/EpsC-like NDP-sugar epimerase
METLHQIIARIFAWPRPFKRATMLTFDIFAVVFAAYLAAWLTKVSILSPVGILLTALATLLINSGLKLYSSVTRHISLSIMLVSGLAAVFSTLALAIIENIIKDLNYSTKTAIVYCLLTYSLFSGSRLLVRSYFSYRSSTEKENIIIYGAGSAGQQLVVSLISGRDYNPVAFIDDKLEKQATYLHGIRVYAPKELDKLIDLHHPQKILLALPTAARKRRQEIINHLENYKTVVQSIPNMADIVSGKMKIDQVQDVSIDDLLGRDAVPPKP